MIVTCPACSSRYRIKDEKIRGRGAKISCPKCDHKFVVHREADPAADARGVPVTFARGGKKIRKEFEEDDEADVPTTVMPHGSQIAQQIKDAAAAATAEQAAYKPSFDKQAAYVNAVARNERSAPMPSTDVDISDDDEPPARQLRSKSQKVPASGGFPTGLAIGMLLLIGVVLIGALKFTGVM